MSSRVGQVWELVYRNKPAEIVAVVSSLTRDSLKSSHTCLVLSSAGIVDKDPVVAWAEGSLKRIGDWDDENGWRRIA